MEEIIKLNVNNSLDNFDKNTLKVDNHDHIYFLFYTTKKINNIPYLQFLLEKNTNNKLNLPEFKKNNTFFQNLTKLRIQIKRKFKI